MNEKFIEELCIPKRFNKIEEKLYLSNGQWV